jgi:Rieske Fe-S protein
MTRIPVERAGGLARRTFFKLCAATAAAVGVSPGVLAQAARAPLTLYQRVRLLGSGGSALRASDLRPGISYVFHYPFRTTPCFLLDLGAPVSAAVDLRTEAGGRYRWPGGVGPRTSIVSFSAICAHKMTHPAKSVSFINYRHEEVSYRDHEENLVRRGGVIFCCSEKSVYDPAQGARVLGGPAKQPLCTILLEYDPADDALYALGSHGGEMFQKFFDTFSARLQLEWGTRDVRAPVEGATEVVTIEEYSRTRMSCGA